VAIDLKRHIEEFYEDWSSRMKEEGASVPGWDSLEAEEVEAWGLAYVATVEVGLRMGRAVGLTLEVRNGD